jgi:hypothetical protein
MKIISVTLTWLFEKKRKGIRTTKLSRVSDFIKPFQKEILDNQIEINIKTKKI